MEGGSSRNAAAGVRNIGAGVHTNLRLARDSGHVQRLPNTLLAACKQQTCTEPVSRVTTIAPNRVIAHAVDFTG